MRVLHSFWTKPFFEPKRANDPNNRGAGGFPDKKHFYMCWALSALQIKRYFGNVHLVTDSVGKHLFVDLLQLPYDTVDTALDAFADYNSQLWAMGKVYTYSIQREPFLHVDGDLIFWDGIQHLDLRQPIVCDFEFTDSKAEYAGVLDILRTGDYFLPPSLARRLAQPGYQYQDANAGVIGGLDYPFFQQYAKLALHFAEQNFPKLLDHELFSSLFNCICEQQLLHCEAQAQQRPITYLRQFHPAAEASNAQYLTRVQQATHVHLFNRMNKYFFKEEIETWLSYLYPDYYQRITRLLQQQYL